MKQNIPQKSHWENVYSTKQPNEVSWTQKVPRTSLDFIKSLNISKSDAIIHIVTETAKTINQNGFKKIGLLGTKFTMEMDFYRQNLESFGLEVITPEKQETREYIQYTLSEELGVGIINPVTKEKYKEIINELVARGAECIVLGCTEIPMLVTQDDFEIPLFDTTKIHSQSIVEFITS